MREGGEKRERKKESVAIHIQGKVQYIYKMYIYVITTTLYQLRVKHLMLKCNKHK